MQSAAEMPAQMHLHLKAHHPVLAFSCEDIAMHAQLGNAGTPVSPASNFQKPNIEQPEINRELSALHDRLNMLDSALASLGGRLSSVMRASDSEEAAGSPSLSPLTELGTQIRSATSRVEIHTEIVADILQRLEIE